MVPSPPVDRSGSKLPDPPPHDGSRAGDVFSGGTWVVQNGVLINIPAPVGGFVLNPKDGH